MQALVRKHFAEHVQVNRSWMKKLTTATSNFAVVSLGISQMKLRVPSSLYREMSCHGLMSTPLFCTKVLKASVPGSPSVRTVYLGLQSVAVAEGVIKSALV